MQSKGMAGFFLALPSPLRRIVVDAVSAPRTSPLYHRTCLPLLSLRSASTSAATSSRRPPPSQPDRDGGPLRSLSFLPSARDDSPPAAVPARPPRDSHLDRATALFVRPPPQFLYSAPRFLHLPANTHMPEVCILGRSNVGKSTLLNALAGLETRGLAGRSHGSKASRPGLAITSARAGCTTMMNGYGFGPPTRVQQPAAGENQQREAEAATRSRRRAQGKAAAEPPPRHSLVLLDMPGYGFMSRSEWGVEITKYLQRRAALRGAVLLVDALAGLKDGDRQALAMLRDAGVRTAVVLTKADKLLLPGERSSSSSSSSSSGEEQIRERCAQVWEELRRVERGSLTWTEGSGWEREIFVTGAGEPRRGGLGVAGARLAICRLAGLSQEGKAAVQNITNANVAAGRRSRIIVPFDQINWAEVDTTRPSRSTTEEVTADLAEERLNLARRPGGRSRPWKKGSAGGLGAAGRQEVQRASF